jgi:four helix bundle protein
MQNPDNLRVFRQAENLPHAIYDLTTAFPADERFSLTAQMRRAAISATGSNIFEGCGRQNNKSLIAFLYMANSAAAELIFQLRVAARRNYGDPKLAAKAESELIKTRRMLWSLTSHLESKLDPPNGGRAQRATPNQSSSKVYCASRQQPLICGAL